MASGNNSKANSKSVMASPRTRHKKRLMPGSVPKPGTERPDKIRRAPAFPSRGFALPESDMTGHMGRRFPPTWSVEKIPGELKVVDANGQSLAYIYSRETKDAADIAGVLTEDEARRIASNMAKLPALLSRDEKGG